MHTGPGTEKRHFYQKQTNFQTGSGSCFDLKHGKHILALLIFSSKTETGFRNMRNIGDPCFKSKHEPEPV
jgi:hypothetical protein